MRIGIQARVRTCLLLIAKREYCETWPNKKRSVEVCLLMPFVRQSLLGEAQSHPEENSDAFLRGA